MKELDYPALGLRCYFETLPNGLPVYVLPRPGFGTTFALLAVGYGGADVRFRTGGRVRQTGAGTARLLARCLFGPGADAGHTLSAGGAVPGFSVSAGMTAFHFSCTGQAEEHLRTFLTGITLAHLDPDRVCAQRTGLRRELECSGEDPEARCRQALLRSLYTEHPIRDCADTQSVARITPEVLETCRRAFYRPDNMVLCVTGRADPRRVFQTAAAAVPPGDRLAVHRDYGAPEPPESACQETAQEMPVSAPRFLLGFKAGEEDAPRRILVGELAARVLAGPSSPLYQRLYRDGLMGGDFRAEFEAEAGTSRLLFGGVSGDPAAVAEAILSEGVRIAWNGLDDALFRRVKKAAWGERLRCLDGLLQTCVRLARGHFAGHPYLDFTNLYDGITRQEVEELLRENVTASRSTLSIIRPKGVYTSL